MKMKKRHPLNVIGDFYVEDDCCTACGLPQAEAPGFLAELNDSTTHCYVIRQPQTPEQVTQAISAMMVAEFNCIRYSGNNAAILKEIESTGNHISLRLSISVMP
jgi:hypothetical protein